MSDTLYRKYRPQDFTSVVGQSHIVDVLKAQLVKGKVGQSYILIGPRGTGKTSVGRILAKAVNCTSLVDGNPCGKCDNCKLFQEGKSLDFVEIDAASNRSIDDIKILKEKISFAPIQFKRKVYIIDEVHMLSKDAFNALLKTLEEPPTHALFILATTEVTKVPITILSRCQRFDFKLATLTNLKDVLRNISLSEKKNIEDEVLDTIAEMGRGSFRDSQSILQKLINHSEDGTKVNQDMALSILGLSQIKELTSLFDNIYEGDNEKSQGILKEILISGVSPSNLTSQLIRYSEKALGISKYKEERIYEILESFLELEKKLRLTDYDDLAMELCIYNLSNKKEKKVEKKEIESESKPSKTKDDSIEEKTVVLEKKDNKDEKVVKEEVVNNIEKVDMAKTEVTDKYMAVKGVWLDLLTGIRARNVHLASFLSQAVIDNVEGNVIRLKLKYAFHKSKIDNGKSKEMIEDELKKLTGSRMILDTYVGGSIDDEKKPDIVKDVFADLM
jgi:DNA polymerase-3 subunit gamma/tau